MNKFIAYFDFLGFRSFIENNSLDEQIHILLANFISIESSLGKGKFNETSHGVVADLSDSRLNCLNFSDTIIFWTNDDSNESLNEILEVSYNFNWREIGYSFPVRGAIVFDEIYQFNHQTKNGIGGQYSINSVIGKGLIRAYTKANLQNWAGTVLDESFIEELIRRGYDLEKFLLPYAKKFRVPYIDEINLPEEYVLNLVKGSLNKTALDNFSIGIRENFAQYNKPVDNPSVQVKISNTLEFLESFYDPEKDIET